MKLGRKASLIRNVAPGEGGACKPARKINIGRFVYLTLLVLVVLLLSQKALRHFLYVRGYGQVVIARLNVQQLSDIRLLQVFVQEGEAVKIGTPLFSFTRETDPQWTEKQDQLRRRKAELQEQIRVQTIEKNYLSEQLVQQRQKLEQAEEMVRLRVMLAGELEATRDHFRKTRSRYEITVAQIAHLQKQLEDPSLLEAPPTTPGSPVPLTIQISTRVYPDHVEISFTGNRSFEFTLTRFGRAIRLRPDSAVTPSPAPGAPLPQGLRDIQYQDIQYPAGNQHDQIAVFPAPHFPGGDFEVGGAWYFADTFELLVKIRDRMADKMANKMANKMSSKTLPLHSGENRDTVKKKVEPILYQTITGEVARSPFSGMITRIYFDPHEVAMTGEKIMNIFNPNGVRIKGFFDQGDIRHIRPGTPVTMEFPDGIEYGGIVSRLYHAALPMPPEFQKKYESTRRGIVTDIQPLNFPGGPYREIYKMNVRLHIRKVIF